MEYSKVPLTCETLLVGYQIDTNGILYGKNGKPLRPSTNPRGYLIQAFSIDGKMKAWSMHNLVARQFIPNPKNKPTVNHKNGNKKDNRVENLEWATRSEQMQHASNILHVLDSTNKIQIIGIGIKAGDIKIFPSCNEAARYFDVHRSALYSVINGRRKSCAGYIWIRKEGEYKHLLERLCVLKEEFKKRPHQIRKVGMFSKIDKLIKIYPSAYATRLDGFCHKAIYECCSRSKRRKSYKGYIWKFIDN